METIRDAERSTCNKNEWETPITTKPIYKPDDDPSTPASFHQHTTVLGPAFNSSNIFSTPIRSCKRRHEQGENETSSPQTKRSCSPPTLTGAIEEDVSVSESELEAFAEDFIAKCPAYYKLLKDVYQGEAANDVSEFTDLGDVTNTFHNDSPSSQEQVGSNGPWKSAKAWKAVLKEYSPQDYSSERSPAT